MTPVLTGPLERPFLPSLQREPVRGLAPPLGQIAASNPALSNQLDPPGFEAVQPIILPSAEEDDWERDNPKEECGVFGIYAPGQEVARITFFGLFALQHRGQESAGIAVSNGRHIKTHKDMGLVTQVFAEKTITDLQGMSAIGHTRYSTTGSSILCNAQPNFRYVKSG